ncbi:hypothetical protein Tco_0676656 [Tanacetum coccineum]
MLTYNHHPMSERYATKRALVKEELRRLVPSSSRPLVENRLRHTSSVTARLGPDRLGLPGCNIPHSFETTLPSRWRLENNLDAGFPYASLKFSLHLFLLYVLMCGCLKDFYTKFYNSLGSAPNRCSVVWARLGGCYRSLEE